MKISLSDSELNKCYKLLEVKEANLSSVEILIEYLTFHFRDISVGEMTTLRKKMPVEKAFCKMFKKCLDIKKNNDEFNEINEICNIEKFTLLDDKEYKQNEYYKNIKPISAKEDTWKFVELDYAPYEGFVSDEIEVNPETFAEHTPVSFFENRFPFLAVMQGDEIWMSIMPHEINTMKEPIKNANGNVLVLGLGLGYFLYQIADKKDVKNIDVVENDPRVIRLFNDHLLEKFPHQEKINIMLDDGIKYLTRTKKKYDYVFSDIWHNVGDGEILYIMIKNLEHLHPQTRFDYWIEKSMLAMLRRQTLTVFQEVNAGYKDSDYKKAANDNDKIINAIYMYHKNTSINSYNDLHKILTDEELSKMAANLKLN